jgi:hypothetical protein
LARELASIDIVSGGRLEVGLGAGYNPLDYSRSGIAMDPAKVRVDRLIEHTLVLKALWSDQPTTFDGVHYRIENLDGTPKPSTPGGPPLLVAGGGGGCSDCRSARRHRRSQRPSAIRSGCSLCTRRATRQHRREVRVDTGGCR